MTKGATADEAEFKGKVDKRIKEVMRLLFLTVKDKIKRQFGCFEIFGLDFLLDKDLVPHLIEVSKNPSLFLDTLA